MCKRKQLCTLSFEIVQETEESNEKKKCTKLQGKSVKMKLETIFDQKYQKTNWRNVVKLQNYVVCIIHDSQNEK